MTDRQSPRLACVRKGFSRRPTQSGRASPRWPQAHEDAKAARATAKTDTEKAKTVRQRIEAQIETQLARQRLDEASTQLKRVVHQLFKVNI